MRYLGLDLGTRTLGVSLSDTTLTIASAYGTIRFEDSDYDSLLDLSLWAMADLLLTAFQCRVAMQYRFGGSLKFWEKMLLYCPPVIIFPVLFYICRSGSWG